MNLPLNDVEIRVLGSLMEKEVTTPEYYPLTLNALVTACNQKSNREPVVSYDEATVADALDLLREKNLVIVCRDGRTPKYDNYFQDSFHLSLEENAVMCVLMLRGPQTVGEIRVRSERIHEFASLEEVEATLDDLAAREESPLVVKLPRQAGQKEQRYTHLLGGEPDPNANQAQDCADLARIDRMEEEIEALRIEVRELREQFSEFRRQFE